MKISLTVLCLLTLPSMVIAAKILFLAYPSFSHLQSMAILGDVLNERGHEIWMSSTSNLEEKLKLKSRNIKVTPFSSEDKLVASVENIKSGVGTSPGEVYFQSGKRILNMEEMKWTCHVMLTDELFLATIKEQKFDLVVLDIIPIVNMLNLIPYKFDIPFVYFGPAYSPYHFRIPYSPSFVPFPILPMSDRMSFMQRVVNTIINGANVFYDPFSYYRAAAIYVPEKPYIEVYDLILQAQLYIIERDDVLLSPVPTMPNIKRINPITSITKDKIPQEYSTFLDRSKNGVILVSFGSMVPTNNNTMYTKLVTAFRNTKYDFIIKGDFVGGNERMMVSKWIPQRSLLSHKNVKLFITHCGANGVGEAINNGVPMLGFPIFAEQPANAHNMAARGYGLYMELFTAKSDEILANINEVIENPSYKLNVIRASQILKELNKRNNSTEEATFWIEHVLKFGGDYMRSSSVDMPLYQYLILDVLAFILLAVSIVLAILFYCFKTCYKRVCGRKMKSE
ncbi:hypothetical protein SNE40_003546 [Patella caerulea]|uniref:UDP-glucuronosyltransferase n=1 Tax=Patella caerulea TaxID=87958 RepID=A0AAN8Q0Y4_PATCE